MNWKIRFKNPTFWAFIAMTIFTNITVKLGVEPLDLVTWQSVGELLWHAIANPVVLVSTMLNVFCGAIDFTTEGVGDSDKVLTYTSPKIK